MERVPWYVSRRPLMASVRSKELRLYLTPEHWEVFDAECQRTESYRGRLASQIIGMVCEKAPDPEHLVQQVRDALVILSDMRARSNR